VKIYSPDGEANTVYDAASNCLTLAYKQNKNYFYILTLLKDQLVVRMPLQLCCVSFSNKKYWPSFEICRVVYLLSQLQKNRLFEKF